jgi:hypothetical protein
LTVLVSILSNTFNQINRDAIAEQMYRRAVSTFQGVKSDGIFSFQPPINILALVFLWPARFMVTPHLYHKIIVFCARLSNLPLLLIIRFVERQFLLRDHSERSDWLRPSTYFQHLDLFGGARTELNAVFEFEDDIDDDVLPGGAFDIHDGVMTPAVGVGLGDTSTASTGAAGGDDTMGKSMQLGHNAEDRGRAGATMGVDVDKGGDAHRAARERSRQRRTQSMSDWGGTIASTSSTPRARPTILSKLYGYGSARGSYRRDDVGYNNMNTPTVKTPTSGSSRLSSLWLNSTDEMEGNDEELEAEREALKERLERIEEGQKRIEEALKGLGGGGD